MIDLILSLALGTLIVVIILWLTRHVPARALIPGCLVVTVVCLLILLVRVLIY